MDSSKGQQHETKNLARDVTWSHVTWSQKYTDFSVESKDGFVFKCHKYVLDQVMATVAAIYFFKQKTIQKNSVPSNNSFVSVSLR